LLDIDLVPFLIFLYTSGFSSTESFINSLALVRAKPSIMSSGLDHAHDGVDNEKNMHEEREVLSEKEIMTDAQNAETREHEMGLWEAVKDHPMACFWAFVFCFTIVSPPSIHFHARGIV
jgi:hypothetical protein